MMAPTGGGGEPGGAAEHCAGLVRTGDRDRYLAALFAAADRRPHLLALYAFGVELAAVRTRIREPIAGEFRFQWWRDALDAIFAGRACGHPVADSLAAAVAAGALPRAPFEAMIDARAGDLDDRQMPTLNDLEGYFGETESALFQLAALILSRGQPTDTADAAGHAGVAYGLAKMLSGLGRRPWQVALIPADLLAVHGFEGPPGPADRSARMAALIGDLAHTARHHLDAATGAANALGSGLYPAFLPLAPVAGDLARIERRPVAARRGGEGSLQRQWAIWRAARRGRL